MGRPVPRQLLRNELLDLTTIVPATAYHRRSYAERYSKQIPENLSRKGCAPIIGEPRGVTWGAYIFVVVYAGDHHHADPQTALL